MRFWTSSAITPARPARGIVSTATAGSSDADTLALLGAIGLQAFSA